jgi:hypothetical protein
MRQTVRRSFVETPQLSVQALTFLKELEAPRPPRAGLDFHLVTQQLIEQCSGMRSTVVVRGPDVRRLTGKSGLAKAKGVAAANASAAMATLKVLVFISRFRLRAVGLPRSDK